MSVVIITGCSRGIGYETALSFARSGSQVYACVRDLAGGTELKKTAADEDLNISICQLDITKTDSFDGFINQVLSTSKSIDVLVNNAGILRFGALEDTSEADLREVMETNFFGAILLTKAVLPQMRSQRSGKIIMMSSLSGIAGLPGDVAYSASKFALEGATEALRHEVSRWGIHLALVEAGQYATGLFSSGKPDANLLPENSVYRDLVEHQYFKTKEGLAEAMDARSIGNLMVKIANSDGSRLRWQADPLAKKIFNDLYKLSDSERDLYLRQAADVDWWLNSES